MPADPRLMALPALRRAAEEEAQGMADGLGLSVTQRAMLLERVMARACDPTRPASRDAVARLVAAALCPGLDVEGVILHRSWRGFWELHVWIRGERGRAREFSFGERFSGEDDGSGERGTCVAVESVADPAEALALIALAVLVPVTPEPPNAGERP